MLYKSIHRVRRSLQIRPGLVRRKNCIIQVLFGLGSAISGMERLLSDTCGIRYRPASCAVMCLLVALMISNGSATALDGVPANPPVREIGAVEAEACAKLSQTLDQLRQRMRTEHKAARRLLAAGTIEENQRDRTAYDLHRQAFADALNTRELVKKDFTYRNCTAPYLINYDVFRIVCADRLTTRFCRGFKEQFRRLQAEKMVAG